MSTATLDSNPTAASAKTTKAVNPKKHVEEKLKKELGGYTLKGEIVAWKAAGPHKFKHVVKSLEDAGLDPKVVRERLPRNAFARSLKELGKNKVVDVLSDDKDTMTFQFSGKQLDTEGKEILYSAEDFLTLTKDTGIVASKNQDLAKKAQDLVNENLVKWTTGDITSVIQRLFDQHADLIPVREQGGAYFVFASQLPFVDKIEGFLLKLGGKMKRFPVPEGSKAGDAAVQDSLTDYLAKLVADHEAAIENFDASTREGTFTEAAERINLTRTKIQAYAQLLTDQGKELLEGVDSANVRLAEKVAQITEEKKALPKEEQSAKDLIVAALTEEGQTMKELVAKSGATTTAYTYLKKLVAEGKVLKDGAKYRLPPKEGAAGEKVPA